jgi:hypothetical protein
MSPFKKYKLALQGNLRLLVMIRESLKLQGVPDSNVLMQAVVTQANVCGLLLPNDMRMSKEELKLIREGLENPSKPPALLPKKPGEMVILTADQLSPRIKV